MTPWKMKADDCASGLSGAQLKGWWRKFERDRTRYGDEANCDGIVWGASPLYPV